MSKNIRPLQDRLLVQRKEQDTKSAGGIFLPEQAKEKPIFGTVISLGSGKILENGERRPIDLKVNDVVLFGKYAGTEVKLDDTDYLVLREEDIMGVVEA